MTAFETMIQNIGLDTWATMTDAEKAAAITAAGADIHQNPAPITRAKFN